MPLLFPKPKRKVKPRKPLKRGTKNIAARAVFEEWGKNCTKSYRRRVTDAEVRAKAEEWRLKRLSNPTLAEEAFTAILIRLGVKFERERIWLNGDRWILTDFFIPSVSLVIELDGEGHRLQKGYDHGRSMWLARQGIKVVRL